jgi:RimJ/RimL family protein N-acetyltransferase
MAFKYEEAVPWGRSFDEYRRMFDLTPEDVEQTILLDLLPIKREHAPEMFALLGDASLYEFTNDSPPHDIAALASRYEQWERRTSPDGSELWLNWLLKLRENGKLIGHVQASMAVPRASIAWVVGAQWQRQGYATEAATAMLAWLSQLGVHDIRASIHPSNIPSVRVAEHLGLRRTEEFSGSERLYTAAFNALRLT